MIQTNSQNEPIMMVRMMGMHMKGFWKYPQMDKYSWRSMFFLDDDLWTIEQTSNMISQLINPTVYSLFKQFLAVKSPSKIDKFLFSFSFWRQGQRDEIHDQIRSFCGCCCCENCDLWFVRSNVLHHFLNCFLMIHMGAYSLIYFVEQKVLDPVINQNSDINVFDVYRINRNSVNESIIFFI